MLKHVQVAAAGEDEEDLRVVDGQQRAAGWDDEHGGALVAATSAILRSAQTGGRGDSISFLCRIPKDKSIFKKSTKTKQ